MDRSPFLRRYTIAAFVAFTLVVTGVFVRQGWLTETSRDRVRHTHEVREHIQHVYQKVKDIELGQRGFVLSGDDAYLAPYINALNGAPPSRARVKDDTTTLWEELALLRTLTADNDVQQKFVASLESLARRRADLAARMIRLRRERGLDVAVTEMGRAGGRRLMDSTRAVVGAMLAEEDRLLGERRFVETREMHTNSIILYTVVGLFYAALAWSLLAAAASRRRRVRAERELERSRKLQEAVIHSGSHAIFSTDNEGRLILFNLAAERMFGFKAGEVLGRKAAEALQGIHDRDQIERRRKRLEARLGRPVRGLELFVMEPGADEAPDPDWTLYRRDGEMFLGSMVVSELTGTDGRVYGHMCAVRDVTARRMMERRLAESNAMLKALVDSSPFGILAADSDGKMIVFNKAAERMLGMSAAVFLGGPAEELMHRMIAADEIFARTARVTESLGRPPEGVEAFTHRLPEDPAHGLELDLLRHDGARFPGIMAVSLIQDPFEQRPLGAVALINDLSEQRRLEDNLRRSNTLFNAVITSTDQAIIAVDLEGTLILYNPAAERMEGYAASEFLGKHTSYNTQKTMIRKEIEDRAERLRIHYGRVPEDVEVFTLPLPDDPPGGVEWTFVNKSGRRYPVSMSVSEMKDSRGVVMGYMAVIRDITATKAMQRTLQESNTLLNAVIHGIDYALFVADPAGMIRIFSKGAERMLGYPADRFVGKPVVEATAPVFLREELEARAARLVEQYGRPPQGPEIFNLPLPDDGPFGQEWTNVRADGSHITVALSVWELKGDDGVHQGSVAIARDITRIKLLEHDLQESSARLQAVLDGIDYAIFAADRDGILQMINRGAERILGYSVSAMIGRPVSDLAARFADPAELRARASRLAKHYGRHVGEMELISLPLPDDGPFGQEWSHTRPDGSRITLAFSVYPLRDDDGQPSGVVALARDITQLKALDRMKNEFISTVSHELRTPLTSIRGALGLVSAGAAGALPEKAGELISIAHRNSERLVHIINDILDIEKIESGRLTLQIRALDAAEQIRLAVESHQAYADKYGVRLILKGAPAGALVLADPERLMQVFANLLSNAAKFSPKGGEVWIDAAMRGGQLRFTVRDFGAGIPEEFQGRIFEKFAQAEGNDARRRDGTGLGLSITRKLVETMQGRIGFTTETGKGTEFHVDLPLAGVPTKGPVPGRGGADDGERPRVLVCEDDADVGSLLRLLLERAGLDTDVAGSLEEARGFLKGQESRPYAALTLDLMLPDGSGLALLRELRREPLTQDLPVIVISARAEEGRRELNGDAIGMIDWMTKPIDEQRLTTSLRRALGSAARPRILHIEDDADFREVLARSLRDAADWVGAATLKDAETQLAAGRFDLVVLDLDLPDGSGLSLLERLKSLPSGPVPVLILSASEMDNGIRKKVEAALVKSRLSEERIVQTILTQIRKVSRTEGGAAV